MYSVDFITCTCTQFQFRFLFFQYQSFCLYGQYRTCHFPFGLRWIACVQGKLSVRKSSLIFTTDLTCKIITISNTLGALVILSGLHSILSLTIKKSLFILSRTCQQHAEYTKPLIKSVVESSSLCEKHPARTLKHKTSYKGQICLH